VGLAREVPWGGIMVAMAALVQRGRMKSDSNFLHDGGRRQTPPGHSAFGSVLISLARRVPRVRSQVAASPYTSTQITEHLRATQPEKLR